MQLSLLQPITDRPGPWASVYADVSHTTEDAAKQRELSANDMASRLTALGADRATRDAVHEALAAAPPRGEPGARAGRALFATDGEVVLDAPLPGPPAAPFATWSPVARVAPLVEATGGRSPCLVAFVDRTGADFILRDDTGGDQPAGGVEGETWPVHRTATADWSERHFQTRVENTWERNAGEIARAAQEAYENSGAAVLLLAGDPRERRSVYDKLPKPLRSVTYESEHGGRAAGADSVRLERDIAQVRAVHERERTAEVMGRFHAGEGPRTDGGGTPYAASGVPALVEAAREHRIDTLLIAPHAADANREVWVGPRADQVASRSSEVPYLGEVRPASARADDALLRAAAASGAETVVVRDPEDAPAGGLGAILRWNH
ncbi:baeRF2 domain-containing protein [Streptomyces sp. NPDC001780]